MPRTLFWLLYIHCTCIADGTHQTSTKSLLNLNICPSVAPTLLSQHRRNQCQVSVARRRQLALCPCLLGTAYKPGASLGVHPVGQKSLGPVLPARLVTSYSTMDQAICKRHWHSASYNLLQKLDTNLLYEDTSLGATVGQTLKFQWSLHGSLVCTMCCHHAAHIHQNGLLPRFLKSNCKGGSK